MEGMVMRELFEVWSFLFRFVTGVLIYGLPLWLLIALLGWLVTL